MLNNNQVKELFEKEAVLIGSRDAVPLYRVRELFGDRAAGYLTTAHGSERYNIFGVGDFQCPYVTVDGFRAAASFANVEAIRDTVGEPAGWGITEQLQDSLIPPYILSVLKMLRMKYPEHTSWGIIEEVLEKAATTEKKRLQKKGVAV